MTLFYLRWACLILWGVVAVALAPSAWRQLRGSYSSHDEYRAGFFFTALLFVGIMARWLFRPWDDHMFAAIYACTAALAAYVLILTRQSRSS